MDEVEHKLNKLQLFTQTSAFLKNKIKPKNKTSA